MKILKEKLHSEISNNLKINFKKNQYFYGRKIQTHILKKNPRLISIFFCLNTTLLPINQF